MTDRVHIYEVGPRDGLQNEAGVIAVEDKIALIDHLLASGVYTVEVGSFVSPKWVPQMADTDRVLKGIASGAARTSVLIPNMRGWQGYLATGVRVDEIAVFISASEGFSRANLNCTIAESVDRLAPVVAEAAAAGIALRGYISCVTDCPYDGPTAPEAVLAAAHRLRALAPMPLSLGDTIGKGRPERVGALLDLLVTELPVADLAGHFHDTDGRALQNIEAALHRGVRTFDSSVGGLGGCPYAPGAPGNAATEEVVGFLHDLGLETGIDPEELARAGALARGMRHV